MRRTLPRPPTLNFNFKGEAEEGANQYDAREDTHGCEGGFDSSGIDDVAGDQEFEPEENRPSEVAPVALVCGGESVRGPTAEKHERGDGRATQDEGHANGLNRVCHGLRPSCNIHDRECISGSPDGRSHA